MSDSIDIDRIVHEVVRRLRRSFSDTSRTPASSKNPSGNAQINGAATNGAATNGAATNGIVNSNVDRNNNAHRGNGTADDVLCLDDDVVSLAQLGKRLDGIRQVVVSEGAVVTPSARDELRSRDVEFVRSKGDLTVTNVRAQQANMRLMIATEDNSYYTGKWIAPESVEADYAAARGSLAQLNEIESSLSRPSSKVPMAICVTARPHRIACEANRRTPIRAAVVSDLPSVRDVLNSLDANMLILRCDANLTLSELLNELFTRVTTESEQTIALT